MNSIECASCSTTVTENSTFCYNCGFRIRCKSCNNLLVKNAKFCSSCGDNVELKNENSQLDKTTISYHWTKDEIKCEASLTNEVGKEGITSLIQNITNHQNLSYKRLEDFSTSNPSKTTQIEDEKNIIDYIELETEKNTNSEQANSTSDMPHIKDLEITLNCTETEWILIYAYYESTFATKAFTRQAVRATYIASRKTDARLKNFETNWKSLYKLYFATLNDEQVKFKTDNLIDIQNLIKGVKNRSGRVNSKSNKSTKKTSNEGIEKGLDKAQKGTKSKRSSINKNYSLETDLNLIPKEKQSLKDFFNLYNITKTPDIVLIIVYYLEKIINQQNIGENTIYTCYKNLSLPIPNIRQALNNIHNRQGYINTSDFSNLKVTVTGENYLEHNMQKK